MQHRRNKPTARLDGTYLQNQPPSEIRSIGRGRKFVRFATFLCFSKKLLPKYKKLTRRQIQAATTGLREPQGKSPLTKTPTNASRCLLKTTHNHTQERAPSTQLAQHEVHEGQTHPRKLQAVCSKQRIIQARRARAYTRARPFHACSP